MGRAGTDLSATSSTFDDINPALPIIYKEYTITPIVYLPYKVVQDLYHQQHYDSNNNKENTTATVGACIVTMDLAGKFCVHVCASVYTYTLARYISHIRELQRKSSRECPGVDSTGSDAAPATTSTITTSIYQETLNPKCKIKRHEQPLLLLLNPKR